MTLQSFKGGVYFPDPLQGADGYVKDDSATLNLNAVGNKVGFLFDAPFTGNIDRVFAYIGAHTSVGTLDVRLETIDLTTGLPSGTLVATNTNGAFITSGVGKIDVTLTAVAPVTKGTQYALVIVQAAGSCIIRAGIGNRSSSVHRRGHGAYFSAAAWSTRTSANTYSYSPYAAFHYDNGSYYSVKNVFPWSTSVATAFNNASASPPGRERGMQFSLPFPCSVTGFFFCGDLTNSDTNVLLATAAGTTLLTASLDKDAWTAYAAGTNYGGNYVGYFSTSQTLTANTNYVLAMSPQSASSIALREFTLLDTGTVAQMDGMAGGQSCILAYRATQGSGAFTTDTTKRPMGMGVIIDQFDDATGAAGAGPFSRIFTRM